MFNREIIRDHIWVEDVAEVMYQAMVRTNMSSGIYNLGGNHPISHEYVAEIVISTMMEQRVIPNGRIKDYIKPVDIPAELVDKFQFYTHAESQVPVISEIAKDNDRKMADYVRRLIQEGK